MRIICFHTHCFPDTLAPRAMSVLNENANSCGYFSHTDGTEDGARRYLEAAGIGAALVCNIATNPRQESKVNDYAISLAQRSDYFYSAGSLHPDSTNKKAETERLYNAGIKGLKIHPDYVGIRLDDPRYDEIFSLAEEYGMFVISHTGFDPVSRFNIHATPEMILGVLKAHPRLVFIAAHMGGARIADRVLEKLAGTGVYIDTSLSAIRNDEHNTLVKILKEHDSKRVLFGTDTPWSYPAKEIEFVKKAGLSETAVEDILYKNAAHLLGIIN